MSAAVTALALTPVKGTRIAAVDRLEIGRDGAGTDRRFYLIDTENRMLNGKRSGGLNEVVSELRDDGTLALRFPDGRSVSGHPREGEMVRTRFYSETRSDPLVEGPFAAALSDHLGFAVRLVRATAPGRAVDRGSEGAVSLISRASLGELASRAGVASVDARRFRMLIEIDGVAAHAEDGWIGARIRVGSALVAVRGHVGRCLITSRHPESGVVDLPTLQVLGEYREALETTEPLPLGVYGEVLEPGAVAVGDTLSLEAD